MYYLSKNEIERTAERIIQEYYGSEAFGTFPIDIDKIATDFLNLNLQYEKLSDDGNIFEVNLSTFMVLHYTYTNLKLRHR